MSEIAKRIATLEGQILGMIDEIAALKIKVGDSDEPLFDPALFGAIPGVGAPAAVLEEVFVLYDFETGGTFCF